MTRSSTAITARTSSWSRPCRAALDYCKWPEIIGTVAGDDSILVVIKPKETAPVVRKRILDMLQD